QGQVLVGAGGNLAAGTSRSRAVRARGRAARDGGAGRALRMVPAPRPSPMARDSGACRRTPRAARWRYGILARARQRRSMGESAAVRPRTHRRRAARRIQRARAALGAPAAAMGPDARRWLPAMARARAQGGAD